MTVLFDTDTWIVLTRAPFAFGPFEDCHAAYQFDACHGGDGSIITTWHEPEWVCEGCPPAFGAVWFNGDWNKPFVVGPFYDVAEAAKFGATVFGVSQGLAVELDEFPEEADAS
jgi:hypothetical protein